MPAINYPTAIARDIGKKLGETPSIFDWGAKADGLTFTDGAIASGTPLAFTSTLASFTSDDIGKLIVIAGAGVAGVDFTTTIAAVGGAHAITLTDPISTTVSAAAFVYGTDNTMAINTAITKTLGVLLIPFGVFMLSGKINLLDKAGFKLYGLGWGCVLMPASGYVDNFMDVSGSTNVEISHFCIDGTWFPDVSEEIIYGDGSTANPTYGQIAVRGMRFAHCKPLVLGIGANSPNVVEDITYENNIFVDCSWGSYGANTIDTGSSGTKRRYHITRNRFIYVTQPVTSPGNAIFCGHGINEDFEISGNLIVDCPTNGIMVHNRPFAGEATSLTNFAVSSNVIRRAGWNGISLQGGDHVTIVGNTVLNPGQFNGADVAKANGILITTHHSGGGPTITGLLNANIHSNNFTDDQGSPTMANGILESSENPVTEYAQGVIGVNRISGQTTKQVDVGVGMAVVTHDVSSLNWSFGDARSGTARVAAGGDVRADKIVSTDGLHSHLLISPAVSAGGFVLGTGLNAYYDAAANAWKSGTDGTNDGSGAVLEDYGTGDLLLIARPSGASRSMSTATFKSYLVARLKAASGDVAVAGNITAQQQLLLGDRGVLQSQVADAITGTHHTHNIGYTAGAWKAIVTGAWSDVRAMAGLIKFHCASSVTAGSSVTIDNFAPAFIDPTGLVIQSGYAVGIGGTVEAGYGLKVYGNLRVNGATIKLSGFAAGAIIRLDGSNNVTDSGDITIPAGQHVGIGGAADASFDLKCYNNVRFNGTVLTSGLAASQYVKTDGSHNLTTVSTIPASDITGLPASGAVTSQNVGGRSLNTTYQNTGSVPRIVTVSATLDFSGTLGNVIFYCDAGSPPTTAVARHAQGGSGTTIYATMTIVVLPGYYYQLAVVGGISSILYWTEWS